MIRLPQFRHNPIGIDIGSRSLKALQFARNYASVAEAISVDLPAVLDPQKDLDGYLAGLKQSLQRVRSGAKFRGRDAVICIHQRDLFLHNIRVSKAEAKGIAQIVHQKAAERIGYSMVDAEIRYLESDEIRQGDQTLREVIVMACHRPRLESILDVCQQVGFRPISVDVEPLAMLRAFTRQLRRDSDDQERVIYVHVGYTNTAVVIAEGSKVLLIKYIDIGGQHFDEVVARKLDLALSDAENLRRLNAERRRTADATDVQRSILAAMRETLDQLRQELSMCIRYHSVTFRGKALVRLVLSGGEANETLRADFERVFGLETELGDPFRLCDAPPAVGRNAQWDIVAGLAARML